MNNLSDVYKTNINKEIKNNKEYCYLENKSDNGINAELNKIVNSLGPLREKKVLIKTKLREFETYIYKRRKDYIITKELEMIKLKDIISITRII